MWLALEATTLPQEGTRPPPCPQGQRGHTRTLEPRPSANWRPQKPAHDFTDLHVSAGFLGRRNTQPFYMGLCAVCTKKLVKKRKKMEQTLFLKGP